MVNGATATAYGPEEPVVTAAPAGSAIASESAPAAETVATDTATRLAACRMDIKRLLVVGGCGWVAVWLLKPT